MSTSSKARSWVTRGAIAGIAVVAISAGWHLLVRAGVSDFYPASCLGTWQSPEHAQGEPESISGTDGINASDSAAMANPTSQIFCGSFIPPGTDESGDIKSVGLTLAWNIVGLPPVATSTNDATSSTATSTSFAHESPFAFFIRSAQAQDISSDTAIVPDISDSSSNTFTSPPMSDIQTSTSLESSDTVSTIVTSTPDNISGTAPIDAPTPIAPPAPDNDFLKISYSLDGNTWVPLENVNESNWQNLTLSLPITSWSDLEKLQIKVEGIPTTLSIMPSIYLDGMFMEVHYDIPPIFANGGDGSGSSTPQIIQVAPNVTIETPPTSPTPFVPTPTIVNIQKTNDTVSVTIQYVGDFYDGNPIYLFLYPQGTTAERNDAGSAFTFAGVPTEGPSINPLPITASAFDPTTKQATITVISPARENVNALGTDSMVTGTYDVDISYYDSQTWHLIPPQTFTWP